MIIDKPAGITSHDVVSRVRRILKTKRVGHTGTLDPFATGVMVMLIGRATRLAQFLDKDVKEYVALVRFGFDTDTGDHTGNRVSDLQDATALNVEGFTSALEEFRGEILQTPPMFSAKKVGGKKLYEHARKGEVIEREPTAVKIHELELKGDAATIDEEQLTRDVRLRVVCSAGTYIRTLAEDIGRKVGTGAHLVELRRTRAGQFSIDQAVTLEQLEQAEDSSTFLIPMQRAVSHLPFIALSEDRVIKTKNGLSTRLLDADMTNGDAIRMQDADGTLIAVGFYIQAENIVQPKVVLI